MSPQAPPHPFTSFPRPVPSPRPRPRPASPRPDPSWDELLPDSPPPAAPSSSNSEAGPVHYAYIPLDADSADPGLELLDGTAILTESECDEDDYVARGCGLSVTGALSWGLGELGSMFSGLLVASDDEEEEGAAGEASARAAAGNGEDPRGTGRSTAAAGGGKASAHVHGHSHAQRKLQFVGASAAAGRATRTSAVTVAPGGVMPRGLQAQGARPPGGARIGGGGGSSKAD